MNIFVFIVIAWIPLVYSEVTLECFQFFKALSNKLSNNFNISDLTPQESAFLLLSGKNINDLGYFQACNKDPERRYVLARNNTGKLPQDIMVGLCGPKFCTTQDYYHLFDHYLVSFKLRYERETNKTLPLYNNLEFIDPQELNLNRDGLYHMVIYLFGFFALLSIAACSWTTYFKNEDTQVQTEGIPSSDDRINSIHNSNLGMIAKLLSCFNLSQNLKSLCKSEGEPSHDYSVDCLHGIRAISFFYIIFTQTFNYQAIAMKNYFSGLSIIDSWGYLFVLGGLKIIDLFFFLSGFLNAYTLFYKLRNTRLSFKSYLGMTFHRWFRVWPTYMIVLLVFWKLSSYSRTGPLWPFYTFEAQNCALTWWKNAIFLNNWLVEEGFCMDWTWYLAVDFQLYLLLLIFICVYTKSPRVASYGLTSLILSSLGYSLIMNEKFDNIFQLTPNLTYETVKYIMTNPVARSAVYFLGVACGLSYRNYQNNEGGYIFAIWESSSVARFASFFIGVYLIGAALIYPRELQLGQTWSHGFSIAYQSLSGFFFALGTMIILGLILIGKLHILKSFLHWRILKIISRLSFTGYLLHGMIIMIHSLGQDASREFTLSSGFSDSVSNFIIVGLFAGITSLFIERPLKNLEQRFIKYNHETHFLLPNLEKTSAIQMSSRESSLQENQGH